MTALFQWLDVDYGQWKALTRTLLKTDFRLPIGGTASSFGRLRDWLALIATMSVLGVAAALVVFVTRDVLLSGTLALSYLSLMLLTTLLTQHGTTMLSPSDYVILGSRPVTSRTILAIRLTNVLFHTLLVTSLMAYPVVLAYGFVRDNSASRALAAAAAIYLWSIVVALMMVATYAALLRRFGARRFQRVIGYLQMVGAFLAYGGLLLASRVLGGSAIARAEAPDALWLLFLPPAWFASYLELATGAINSTTWMRGALSVVTVLALAMALRGKMSLEYARQLAELSATSPDTRARATRTPLFQRDESRAVALLIVAHFRNDLRVRMGVLGIVPLVLLYVVAGMREDSIDLVALSVLLFPALLQQHFASTDAYQAAWIYRSTPADLAGMVIAAKNVAVAYFLVPFLLFVAGVFTWRTGDAMHAAVHTAILGLLSHVALQGAMMISPRLPFSWPPDKIRGNTSLAGWLLFVILGGQAVLVALDRWVYVSSPRTGAVVVSLVGLTTALNAAVRARARRALR